MKKCTYNPQLACMFLNLDKYFDYSDPFMALNRRFVNDMHAFLLYSCPMDITILHLIILFSSNYLNLTPQPFSFMLIIVLVGDDTAEINYVTSCLDSTSKIKDLGHLRYFLGLEIAYNASGIHFCQQRYILDLLSDNGMLVFLSYFDSYRLSYSSSFRLRTILSDPSIYRRLMVVLST